MYIRLFAVHRSWWQNPRPPSELAPERQLRGALHRPARPRLGDLVGMLGSVHVLVAWRAVVDALDMAPARYPVRAHQA